MKIATIATLAGLAALGSAHPMCWSSGKPPCMCPPEDVCNLGGCPPDTEAACECLNMYCECACVRQMRAFNKTTTLARDTRITKRFADQRDTSPVSLNQEEYISEMLANAASTTPVQDVAIRTSELAYQKDLAPASSDQKEHISAKTTNKGASNESPLPSRVHRSHPRQLKPVVSQSQIDTDDVWKPVNAVARTTERNSSSSSTLWSPPPRDYPTTRVTKQAATDFCQGALICYPVNEPVNCYCYWFDKPGKADKAVLKFALATPVPSASLAARSERGDETASYAIVSSVVRPSGVAAGAGAPEEEKRLVRRAGMDEMCPGTDEAVCDGDPNKGYHCLCQKKAEGKAKTDEAASSETTQEPSTESVTTIVVTEGTVYETVDPTSGTESTSGAESTPKASSGTITSHRSTHTPVSYQPWELSILRSIASSEAGVPPPSADPYAHSRQGGPTDGSNSLAGIPAPTAPGPQTTEAQRTIEGKESSPRPSAAGHTTMSQIDQTWQPYTAPNPKTVTRAPWEESILMHIKTHTTHFLSKDFWKAIPMRVYTSTDWYALTTPSDPWRKRAVETGMRAEGSGRKGKRWVDGRVVVEEVKVMTAAKVGSGGGVEESGGASD